MSRGHQRRAVSGGMFEINNHAAACCLAPALASSSIDSKSMAAYVSAHRGMRHRKPSADAGAISHAAAAYRAHHRANNSDASRAPRLTAPAALSALFLVDRGRIISRSSAARRCHNLRYGFRRKSRLAATA